MTNPQRELDAAHEILRLHQQTLQNHEAYFNKMQEVMNAQARHIEVLEMKVAALEAVTATLYPTLPDA